MGILSGCKALYEIDVRVRPDMLLQRAFGRYRCADQSTIERTLNAFTERNVESLSNLPNDSGSSGRRLAISGGEAPF
jgi:hypothetical protein